MATGEQAGLLDLQKELTCSICTEVLFQPLTLLDCLHTFCGSCLKEWFSWQASQASASKPNPYTCPSCRASVRETRPNATVTTLLDMYLQANPGRDRTQEEQNELRSRYKPGEQVMPPVRVEKVDAADERMLAEVREMSLRDAGVRSSGAHERGTRHRTAERRREPSNDGRQRRSHQQPNSEHERHETSSRRQIGHQSSLRSLMSSSEIDSSEMEEEILRLVDEGWLDGIDLNNLDTSQVDELNDAMDIEQDRNTHRPPILGAYEITQRDIPENVRTTVTIEVRLMQNSVSLHLIPLSQDLVFSKLIRPLRANSGEHQVSTEDRLHRHPEHLQGGLALHPKPKLLDQLRTYLRDLLAQLHGRLLLI
ncbi:MAG: hypothetical protein LQ349_005903 [Xanthoria aureola]|nr:MAG: hypothetical protein LQ349_005903 [Xanthoria aureola]